MGYLYQLSIFKTWAPFKGRVTLVCKMKINISQLTLLRYLCPDASFHSSRNPTWAKKTYVLAHMFLAANKWQWTRKLSERNKGQPHQCISVTPCFQSLQYTLSWWRRQQVCWRLQSNTSHILTASDAFWHSCFRGYHQIPFVFHHLVFTPQTIGFGTVMSFWVESALIQMTWGLLVSEV